MWNRETHPDIGMSDLEAWMENYGTDVINVAYSYVRNYHVAEDIAQDVFLRAYTKYHLFRGQSSVKTWLLSITANRCKDYLRSWTFRHEIQDETQLDGQDNRMAVEETVVSSLVRDELWAMVHGLPLKYREVIILYYQRGLTSAEVAQVLDISEQSVRTRLHRGRSLLKQQMGEVDL